MGILFLGFMATTFLIGYKHMKRKVIASNDAEGLGNFEMTTGCLFAGMLFSLTCMSLFMVAHIIFMIIRDILGF